MTNAMVLGACVLFAAVFNLAALPLSYSAVFVTSHDPITGTITLSITVLVNIIVLLVFLKSAATLS